MNLLLDLGNTRIKMGLFSASEELKSFYFDYSEIDNLFKKAEKSNLKQAAISSVKPIPQAIFDWLAERSVPVLTINASIKLPFKLNYETADTLGSDRICNIAGAWNKFRNQNLLVIDLGSCNTYDFMSASGKYCGGGITPGYHMRFKAMNSYTANLPLLEPQTTDQLIGSNTHDSMIFGTYWGMIGEINEQITQYKQQFSDLIIVATGGSLIYFDKVLKNSIFADPNLTLKGLNSLLVYQNF